VTAAAFSDHIFSDRLLWTFPCGLDKKPRTKHGFKDAVQGVFWPRAPLVGVPTGKRNGFDILDIDGSAGRRWYFRNCDALPATRVHYTQRGVHIFFFTLPACVARLGRSHRAWTFVPRVATPSIGLGKDCRLRSILSLSGLIGSCKRR
jgi:Bifunctional DNA primase/polymerase, N-terminal